MSSTAVGDVQDDKPHPAYETCKVLNEYLLFHFGHDEDLLAFPFGPKDALHFPRITAELCLQAAKEHGIPSSKRCLDLGCAVGRSSFELSRGFDEVLGIDYSNSFVSVCKQLQAEGKVEYQLPGVVSSDNIRVAAVDAVIDRSKLSFMQGNACALPKEIGSFDLVLCANLIDRLYKPTDFLALIPGFVNPGGLLVLTSPYTWLVEFTPKENWLCNEQGDTLARLKEILSPDFDLLELKDVQFFLKETPRKYQWSVAQMSIWKRKL